VTTNIESPFACVMGAIASDKRERHLANARELFRQVIEIREQPSGYAFGLPTDSATLLRIVEFVSLERLCCPFFGFALELEPEDGNVWLRLSGRDGVKAFIRAEMAEFLGQQIRIVTQ
jgi:hypothetical protein